MQKIPFDEKELEVVREVPDFMGNQLPIYNYPISMRDNYIRTVMDKDPVWLCLGNEADLFCPSVIPDNHARAFVFEANMVPPQEGVYVKDMFGIEWTYVATVGGSMERPDRPHPLADANDWEKVLQFPDIDSWDWEASAKANNGTFLNPSAATFAWEINGWWFERLISFMGFEGAVMSLIDEDQQDAVKALFEATTDLGCRIVDKFAEYYTNIDGICVHDDWGSQRSPFFSYDTAEEMIVTYMKKLGDHIHSKGLIADLHSCGHVESRVENFIHAGWDTWTPQDMNDTQKLFEEFGDKISIGIIPDAFDFVNTSAEEQMKFGEEFAKKVCVPGKTCFLSLYSGPLLTVPFREGVYRQSRKIYGA
jgi:hypothetical protein